jgi:catechol 2,3-dioxygenase-like lactoylglutathione lyase family enzyme
MTRVQLALNVDDVDEAVAFYSVLFATPPAKRRPGYANFAIAEPPLKLVLIENPGSGGSLNHLGVEVDSAEQVETHRERLRGEGLAAAEEKNTTCCYAVQDKFWVSAPDGEQWEHYVVLADSRPDLEGKPADEAAAETGDGTCCTGDDHAAACC